MMIFTVTDIAGDLPTFHNQNNNSYNTQTSQLSDTTTTTDYESAHSRLSSMESFLGGSESHVESPLDLPECSSPTLPSRVANEDDDDVWMNQFGKDPLKKSLSTSGSVDLLETETFNSGINTSAKKRQFSTTGRLETTTYSFSIGNTDITPTNEIVDIQSAIQNSDDSTAEPWVKRDSKERQPVRKHLKAVTVKATVNVSPDQQHSPNSSPRVVRKNNKQVVESTRSVDSGISDLANPGLPDNRHSSTTSSDSEKENAHLSVNVNPITAQNKLQDINEKIDPLAISPKHGPLTLPKPKKPLDKKSWTADLIKSKTQKIPDQPQPGSLNEKLLQQGVVKRTGTDIETESVNNHDSENNLQQRSASVGQRSSVRDIRNRFQQRTLDEQHNGIPELSSSAPTSEKYV